MTYRRQLEAIRLLSKAVEQDPEYALGWSGLAGAYITKSSFGWQGDLTEKAKSAALKALALDPNLPEAHVALGQILMRADWDWSGAARAFDRAIALDASNASAHAMKSLLLTAQAMHPDAIREMQLACRLDPGDASMRSDLAWTYNYARDFAAALENAQAAARINSESFTAHRELNKAYLEMKQFDRALDEVRIMARIAGGENRRTSAESAQVYALAGRRKEAEAALAAARSGSFLDPVPEYLIGVANANLGNREAAFQALNAALDTRMAQALWMKVDPELDSIRGDARFGVLMRRLGLER